RDVDLVAVEDVDREMAGMADGRVKRRRAVDTDDHRRRLHAHRIDGGRRHGVARLTVPASHDSDGARESAQSEFRPLGDRVVQGDGSLHALPPMSASVINYVKYRTLLYIGYLSIGTL